MQLDPASGLGEPFPHELGKATAAKKCPPPEVEEAPPKAPPKGRPARR